MSSNKPRYRLKKDLPTGKAGDFFFKDLLGRIINEKNTDPIFWLNGNFDDYPDWFERIEDPLKESFVWDDEIVLEAIKYVFNVPDWYPQIEVKFKKFKEEKIKDILYSKYVKEGNL